MGGITDFIRHVETSAICSYSFQNSMEGEINE